MTTIRIVAICAISMFLGQAWAQDKPVPSGTALSAQDVGGVTNAPRGEAGTALNPARQQAYPAPGNAQQSEEQNRFVHNTFLHH